MSFLEKVLRAALTASCLFLLLGSDSLMAKADAFRVSGAEEAPGLTAMIEKVLKEAQAQAPKAEPMLQLRSHKQLVERLLKAEGYYNCVVKARVSEDKGSGSSMVFELKLGDRFVIDDIQIQVSAEWFPSPQTSSLPVKVGDFLRAEEILEAVNALGQEVSAYPGLVSSAVQHRVTLHPQQSSGSVLFLISNLKRGAFGSIQFQGLENVKQSFLEAKVPWQRGDLFDTAKLEDLRKRYVETGLFSLVHVEVHKPEQDGAEVLVTVHVKEKLYRTVSVGLWGTSDETIGLRAGWEHRNYAGAGERLGLDAEGSLLWQKLSASYRIPESDPLSYAKTYTLGVSREDFRAYTAVGGSTGVSWSRNLNSQWWMEFGPLLEIERIDSKRESAVHGIAQWRQLFLLDCRDVALNPSSGHMLEIRLLPTMAASDEMRGFLRSELLASEFIPFGSGKDPVVLAMKAKLGVIVGASLDDIPKTHRFFAGGAGSIRGYEHHSVSDILRGEPTGGKALMECSGELRWHFTESVGGVCFVDGGYAYKEPSFGSLSDLRWSWGIGLRYYTALAPLRLDVGFPINRRHGDDSWKIYVSIGQAF